MAKKVVSVALHKTDKPIKNSSKTKKLKTLLKNVFKYMKSDTYMFAPLLDPHSYTRTSRHDTFGGEMSCEPMKKKTGGETVKDYLRCDCYLYAPLVPKESGSDCGRPPKGDQYGKKADIDSVGDQMVLRMEETATQGGNGVGISREIENEDMSNLMGRILVKRNLLQKETVKHVVHQNRRSSSMPEEVLPQVP